MKLVQSQFLPRQAVLNKYYAVVTGINCNPYNGPEATAAYDTIKNILMERATIDEEVCIRIYDNETGFGLARYDALGNDIDIKIVLFSVEAPSCSWTLDSLSTAFKKAKVPSIMRPEVGGYSLNWYTEAGTPTFTILVRDPTDNQFKKLDHRHVHISSDFPQASAGRVNDFWVIVRNNTFYNYFKTSDGWINVSGSTSATESTGTPDAASNIWFRSNGLTCQKITADGWDPTRVPVVVSEFEPADKSNLWIKVKASTISESMMFSHDGIKWIPSDICACIVRDGNTWFSGGRGTTFDIIEGTDALGGANLSLNPSAGGGAVEVYRINTDPSNLIGTAKKLVLDADAPDPYVVGADSETVHLRVNQSVVQITEAAYVLDVKPTNARETVTLTKDAKGIVTAFESTGSAVDVYLSWVRKQGDYISLPTINNVKAVSDVERGETGKISTTITGANMNIVFNTSTTTIKSKLIATPNYVLSSTVSYPVAQQTHAKVNDKIKIVVGTSEAMNEMQFTQSAKYSVDSTVFSGNTVTATLTNLSAELADSYDVVYRVRKSGGVWSSDVTNNIVQVDNILPTFDSMTITAPANTTAVRPGSSVSVSAVFRDAPIGANPTVVTDGGVSATVSNMIQTQNAVSFSITPHTVPGTKMGINFKATKTKNDGKLDFTAYLDVISSAATILPNTVNLRLGTTNVINVPFDQTVRLTSLSMNSPDVQVTKSPSVLPQTTLNLEAIVINNHVPSNTVYNMSWSITGMSGIPSNVFQPYTISGFAERTVSLTFPATIVDIGTTITDLSKFTIHGQINTVPSFPVAVERVNTPADLLYSHHYCVINGGTQIQLAEQVKAFGYDADNNITLVFEQQ